jgi:cell division protein FtsN
MRTLLYLAICALLFTASCATSKKSLTGSSKSGSESNIPGASIKHTLMPATPIKEVEEKLVPTEEKVPDNHKYFVIIGSFRSHGNAKKQKSIVARDGFVSNILKNDAGLYRVSVKATDNADEARDEVRRIWAAYPKYSDTWMLVQIK